MSSDKHRRVTFRVNNEQSSTLDKLAAQAGSTQAALEALINEKDPLYPTRAAREAQRALGGKALEIHYRKRFSAPAAGPAAPPGRPSNSPAPPGRRRSGDLA